MVFPEKNGESCSERFRKFCFDKIFLVRCDLCDLCPCDGGHFPIREADFAQIGCVRSVPICAGSMRSVPIRADLTEILEDLLLGKILLEEWV